MKKDLKNMKRCNGCGAILQTEDKQKDGYVLNLEHELCFSCFNLKHYNKDTHTLTKSHFPEINSKGLVIYLVSALHLNTLFMYNLDKFYDNKMILLINHVDLLPKTVNFNKMIDDLMRKYSNDLKNFLEIMPISALKGHYLNDLLETIKHYNFKEVTMIGLQNSGKSTLLKQIASHYNLNTTVLTSKKPGLTKDILKLETPYFTLYDTPGVYLNGFLDDYLPYEIYNKLIPNKLKPFSYNLDEFQSVIVFGLIVVSLIKGETTFVFYGNTLKLHRTKYENAYVLFEKHQNELFFPTVNEFETITFKLNDNKYLINLLDFGYLVVKGPVTLEIKKPLKGNITITEGVIHGL